MSTLFYVKLLWIFIQQLHLSCNFHPFIFHRLLGSGSWGQQCNQRCPDAPVPGHFQRRFNSLALSRGPFHAEDFHVTHLWKFITSSEQADYIIKFNPWVTHRVWELNCNLLLINENLKHYSDSPHRWGWFYGDLTTNLLSAAGSVQHAE